MVGEQTPGALDIRLVSSGPEIYDVELRVEEERADHAPVVRGRAALDARALLEVQLDHDAYGRRLAEQLFADEQVRACYAETRASFAAGRRILRLRIDIDPDAEALQGLRWELLRDPVDDRPLATSRRIWLSRLIRGADRVPDPRPWGVKLRSLIAVAAPRDGEAKYGLAPVDRDGELARAGEALVGTEATIVGRHEPCTLRRLMEALERGIDIVYLVCHGRHPRGGGLPSLFLEDDAGDVDRVHVDRLVSRISELGEPPRLVVLAACEGGGAEDGVAEAGGTVRLSIARMLVDHGVPAVVAMQGKVSMATVKFAMPRFLRELVADGAVERALAVARGDIRESPDAWKMALFLRFKAGRIQERVDERLRERSGVIDLPPGLHRFESELRAIAENSQDWPAWSHLDAGEVLHDELELQRFAERLEDRRRLCFVGPKGCGKTVQMRLLGYRLRSTATSFYWDCERHGRALADIPAYLRGAARIAAASGQRAIVFLDNVHLAPELLIEMMSHQSHDGVSLVMSSRLSAIRMSELVVVRDELRAVEVDLGEQTRPRGRAILEWSMDRRGLAPAHRAAVLGSVAWHAYFSDLWMLRLALREYDWTHFSLPPWAPHRELAERISRLKEDLDRIDDLLYIVAELGRHGLATDIKAAGQMLGVATGDVCRMVRAAESTGMLAFDAKRDTCRFWHDSLARLYWETFALHRSAWAEKSRVVTTEGPG